MKKFWTGNADLCIHFYWLSWLRQASHRKMIQRAVLKLRLWLCHFKISLDTSAFSVQEKKSWSKFSGTDGALYFVHLKVGKFCSWCVAPVHHLFIKANIILEFLVRLLLCIKFCNWNYVLRFFIVKTSDTANIFQ